MAYVNDRKQFGTSISTVPGVQFTLADMEMKIEAARHVVYVAAAAGEVGRPEVTRVSGLGQGLCPRRRDGRDHRPTTVTPGPPRTSRWPEPSVRQIQDGSVVGTAMTTQPSVERITQRAYGRAPDELADRIERWRDDGCLPPGTDSETLAHVLLSTGPGLVMQDAVLGDIDLDSYTTAAAALLPPQRPRLEA
ncbi:acyl-CoA dehydrogenase family protein [Geodermatophilus sp. URMC 64]